MELGPIFRAMIRNKTRALLIVLEVALTLAIVVNCINMMETIQHTMVRPTGLDEASIITVRSQPFSEDFRDDGYLDNARKADLEMIRSLPGVRAAEAVSQFPLSGSGSSSGFKPLGSEMHTLATAVLRAGPDIVETLGVNLIEGRSLTEEDIVESDAQNVLITKAYADRLFPDGNALGQKLQGRSAENPLTIVGIIEYMHGFWPTWDYIEHVTIRPDEPGNYSWGVSYMIRAETSQIGNLLSSLEERMLEVNNGRNVTIRPLSELKAETLEAEMAIVKILRTVIFLLIFVTALGIVGMTSFSVTERTHHIGTRRALGARKFDILRYFLTENWMITTFGTIIGIGLTYGLNFLLVSLVSGAKLDSILVLYGVLLMWGVGLCAAFFPAWKGARISPAIATRNI